MTKREKEERVKKVRANKKRKRACQKSLKHWQRNKWNGSEWSEGNHSKTCALCIFAGEDCDKCSIVLSGQPGCDDPTSAWRLTFYDDKGPMIECLRRAFEFEKGLEEK